MGKHLEQAAKFSESRKSTLSVSDSVGYIVYTYYACNYLIIIQVDSMYRSAFFNFTAYMIYQMSKSHNLDMLFSNDCDIATLDVFLKLLHAYPIPKLAEIKVILL